MANYTGALLLHAATGGANATYRYDWINGELVAVPEYTRVERIYAHESGTDEPPCFALKRDNQDDNETQPLDVEALNKALKMEEEIYANLQERKEQARRLEAAYWLSELDDTAE